MRDYTAARWVWGLVYYFGVIALVLGLLVTGIAVCVLFGGGKDERSQSIVVACCSAGAFVAGALFMAASDLVLATIDTASNTQEILQHLRNESKRK